MNPTMIYYLEHLVHLPLELLLHVHKYLESGLIKMGNTCLLNHCFNKL